MNARIDCFTSKTMPCEQVYILKKKPRTGCTHASCRLSHDETKLLHSLRLENPPQTCSGSQSNTKSKVELTNECALSLSSDFVYLTNSTRRLINTLARIGATCSLAPPSARQIHADVRDSSDWRSIFRVSLIRETGRRTEFPGYSVSLRFASGHSQLIDRRTAVLYRPAHRRQSIRHNARQARTRQLLGGTHSLHIQPALA